MSYIIYGIFIGILSIVLWKIYEFRNIFNQFINESEFEIKLLNLQIEQIKLQVNNIEMWIDSWQDKFLEEGFKDKWN